jgi:hypothetical protein
MENQDKDEMDVGNRDASAQRENGVKWRKVNGQSGRAEKVIEMGGT